VAEGVVMRVPCTSLYNMLRFTIDRLSKTVATNDCQNLTPRERPSCCGRQHKHVLPLTIAERNHVPVQ